MVETLKTEVIPSLAVLIYCVFIAALVHDLAESLVGDITPYCGVSKEDKKRREIAAMQEIAQLIEPSGKRMLELFMVS